MFSLMCLDESWGSAIEAKLLDPKMSNLVKNGPQKSLSAQNRAPNVSPFKFHYKNLGVALSFAYSLHLNKKIPDTIIMIV